ncbi:MAG: GNAT family N-acetyltransferase [Micavibrio sp.]|nr:GNAT family N-acetyltransferase [Micavibrio sp.]
MQLNLAKVQTKPAEPQEVPYINDLFRKLMKPYAEQTWHDHQELEAFYKRNTLSHESSFIFRKGHVKVGFIRLEKQEDHIFLDQIHLEPIYHGQGIGSEALDAVKNIALEAQLPIKLVVLRVNPAFKLYERIGFEKQSEDDARYYMQWEAQCAL